MRRLAYLLVCAVLVALPLQADAGPRWGPVGTQGTGGGGASAFTDLTDTPASISANQPVVGNGTGTALVFGTDDDVPEAGDFGAATDLDANGALNTGSVADNEIDYSQVTFADFDYETAWRMWYSNADGDVSEITLGASGTFLKSNGADQAPTFAAGGSGDIESVWNDDTGDVSALTAAAGDSLDATSADYAIPWVVAADCSAVTAEGRSCWDSDNDMLYIGTGSAAQGSGGDVLSVGTCASGACLDGTSDGGTTFALYDGDSNKITLDVGDLSGDITVNFPTTSGTLRLVADDDDIPESGDFGAALALDADGDISVYAVKDYHIDTTVFTLSDFDSESAWRLFYSDATGTVTNFAFGNSGYVLTSQGATSAPTWTLTSAGDVTGAGDCTEGACLDGSSDGGTKVCFYDTANYKTCLHGAASLGSDIDIYLPGTAATLVTTTTDDDTPEAGDFTNLTAGAGIEQDTPGTIATDSVEAGFLEDGGVTSLTCGGSNAGKMQVMDDGTLEYCDGAATPVLQAGFLVDVDDLTSEDFLMISDSQVNLPGSKFLAATEPLNLNATSDRITAWIASATSSALGIMQSSDTGNLTLSSGDLTLNLADGSSYTNYGDVDDDTLDELYDAIDTALGLRTTGPGSSTDHAIARYDSTTGKVLLNSGVTIDDSNNIAGAVGLVLTGKFDLADRIIFADQDSTPSVAAGNVYTFNDTGANTVTDFDDGSIGQLLFISFNSSNTVIDFSTGGTGIIGNKGEDWYAQQNDHMVCFKIGSYWRCITDRATIHSIWNDAFGDVSALVATTGDSLNASGADYSLPFVNATDCSGHTAEGRCCWDTDDDKLYCGDNVAAKEIGAGGGGDITDVFNCATGDCSSIALADGDFLDMSSVSVTAASEGLYLPRHATDCSAATAEGQVCWDVDSDKLYVGDGAAAKEIGAGGGSPGGSDTHVQWNSGGAAFGGEAEFAYDDTLNQLAVGSPTGEANYALSVVGTGGEIETRTTNTSVTSNTLLGAWYGTGVDDQAENNAPMGAMIKMLGAASWTGASSTPGKILFYTTPTGSTTPTVAMDIGQSGYVGVGTAAATQAHFEVNHDGAVPSARFNHAGSYNNYIRVESTGAYDAAYNMLANTSNWSIGVDASDSYKFKICDYATPNSTYDHLTIDQGNDSIGIYDENPSTDVQMEITSTTGGMLSFKRWDSVTTIDELLGGIYGRSIDGDASPYNTPETGASIEFYAGEAWGPTESPGYISFKTTNDDILTPVERMNIGMDGTVTVWKDSDWASLAVESYSDTAAHRGAIYLRGADGTKASPGAIENGDGLGAVYFGGYDGTHFEDTASITGLANENYGAANEGSRIAFTTTADGATAIHTSMILYGTGGLRMQDNDVNSVAYDVAAAGKFRVLYVDENGYVVVGDADKDNND